MDPQFRQPDAASVVKLAQAQHELATAISEAPDKFAAASVQVIDRAEPAAVHLMGYGFMGLSWLVVLGFLVKLAILLIGSKIGRRWPPIVPLALLALLLAGTEAWAQPIAKISAGGPIAPDGKTEVACDLPARLLKANISSRGLGCCVFRSLEYAGIWQNLPQVAGFPEWMVKNGIAGGGSPPKVKQLLPRISRDRGLPTPQYVQYEGDDPAILKAGLAAGRIVCVTYSGHDVHYRGGIAHMVCLVHYDEASDLACIRDNNFVGEHDLVWMSCREFLARWRGDGGWAFIFLAPPPPPVPRN